MPKIELEIKARLEKVLCDAFETKMASSGYNSKAEGLRKQIRNFLTKQPTIANSCFTVFFLAIKPRLSSIDLLTHSALAQGTGFEPVLPLGKRLSRPPR